MKDVPFSFPRLTNMLLPCLLLFGGFCRDGVRDVFVEIVDVLIGRTVARAEPMDALWKEQQIPTETSVHPCTVHVGGPYSISRTISVSDMLSERRTSCQLTATRTVST